MACFTGPEGAFRQFLLTDVDQCHAHNGGFARELLQSAFRPNMADLRTAFLEVEFGTAYFFLRQDGLQEPLPLGEIRRVDQFCEILVAYGASLQSQQHESGVIDAFNGACRRQG